jgi:hypothetical protein
MEGQMNDGMDDGMDGWKSSTTQGYYISRLWKKLSLTKEFF